MENFLCFVSLSLIMMVVVSLQSKLAKLAAQAASPKGTPTKTDA